MSHHPEYSFATSPAHTISNMPSASPQYYTTRPAPQRASNTTEFRGSTNPDEDWTKISDLAERRRIQNRIAQRNYRKKLKRRLEDLERRAASRSLSPNGEDTDGRSTRESSSEGVVSPPPSSEPHLTDPRDTHYNLPPYTAQYRGAYSPPQHSYYPPTTAAEPTTSAEYAPQQHYLYSYSAPTLSSVVEATCGSSVSSSCSGSEHSYLPLPSARLSSSSGYSVSTPPDYSPKTSPVVYSEDHLSPFMSSYANLTETPTDPSFFSSQYYHDDHGSPHTAGHSPIHIKAEPAYAS